MQRSPPIAHGVAVAASSSVVFALWHGRRSSMRPACLLGSCMALHLQIMQSFLDERLISFTMFLVLKSHALGRRRGLVARPGARPSAARTCYRHLVERRELLVVVSIYNIVVNSVDAARAVVEFREFPRRALPRRCIGSHPPVKVQQSLRGGCACRRCGGVPSRRRVLFRSARLVSLEHRAASTAPTSAQTSDRFTSIGRHPTRSTSRRLTQRSDDVGLVRHSS